MNEQRTDFELLRAFLRDDDQQAFTALARRHLNLVYGTALRKLEDQGAAQEVSQNVFAALARKAWQFAADDSLPAWLHRTALLEATSWLRGELRRRRREKTAIELRTTMKAEEPALHALEPLLDEGLLSLREKDRAALLLRFYEGQSLRAIGQSLRMREDAAQKRVASALEKLAQFFRRRGVKTATGSLAAAALQQTATSAPAIVATSVAQAAAQLTAPSMFGLATVLSHFGALTRTQTTALCAIVAVVPVVWQWNEAQQEQKATSSMQANAESLGARANELAAENDRQRAEVARLNAALAGAVQAQLNDAALLARWQNSQARLRDLLANSNYAWPTDATYVRIPKAVVKDLELQAPFAGSGALSEAALELYGITAEEKAATEQALGNYWKGVRSMMAAHAYETNVAGTAPGRVVKTVAIPPLGEELKTLAQNTQMQLEERLGPERAQMLFGGWDQGAIQIFWPGNLWRISEQPQTFTVWIDPTAKSEAGMRYGASWHSGSSGTSTEGPHGIGLLPRDIFTRFFAPWLEQFGITTPVTP